MARSEDGGSWTEANGSSTAALTRRALLWSAAVGALGLLAPRRLWAAAAGGERGQALAVHNGSVPFAGDRPLLTTVSPGGARGRTRAIVGFVLPRPAKVRLEVVNQNAPGEKSLVAEHQGVTSGVPAHTVEHRLPAGTNALVWEPPVDQTPGTYTVVLKATDRLGTRTITGRRGPNAPKLPQGPVVRVLGLDAVFSKRSYVAGERAPLTVSTDAGSVTVQLFRSGPEPVPTYANDQLNGVPVSDPAVLGWEGNLDSPAPIPIEVGNWASGVYYAQLSSGELRGYAPFIVRPATPASRVAVVMPTNTWAAYNFYDGDGDGYGDSWYVWWLTQQVDQRRPQLHRGVPYRFRSYDLSFLHWLARTGKPVDFYAEDDLGDFPSGDELRTAYDLVVFPGHTEYVTSHAYDVIERFRDLAGHLIFLSANNFFRRVDPGEGKLGLVGLWRDLGRSEAGLCGVQYCGSDRGNHQAPFVVTADGAAGWAFEGTGLGEGSSFGSYGIEVDARAAASPPGTVVLAQIPNALGKPGLTAEMTYYETDAGAKVFAAGALNFGGQILLWPEATQLLENVWERLA